MAESSEKDFLQYRGNKFPRVLRLAWTVFMVFAAIYLIKFLWPDLTQWMNRVK